MWKLKDNVYDFSVLKKYGYKDKGNHYVKRCDDRDVYVWRNGEIIDYKRDSSSYTGYACKREYRHTTKRYIKDLIKDGLAMRIKGRN